jgi:hypothetical protein
VRLQLIKIQLKVEHGLEATLCRSPRTRSMTARPTKSFMPYKLNIERMDSDNDWIASSTQLVQFLNHIAGAPNIAVILKPETMHGMTTSVSVSWICLQMDGCLTTTAIGGVTTACLQLPYFSSGSSRPIPASRLNWHLRRMAKKRMQCISITLLNHLPYEIGCKHYKRGHQCA